MHLFLNAEKHIRGMPSYRACCCWLGLLPSKYLSLELARQMFTSLIAHYQGLWGISKKQICDWLFSLSRCRNNGQIAVSGLLFFMHLASQIYHPPNRAKSNHLPFFRLNLEFLFTVLNESLFYMWWDEAVLLWTHLMEWVRSLIYFLDLFCQGKKGEEGDFCIRWPGQNAVFSPWNVLVPLSVWLTTQYCPLCRTSRLTPRSLCCWSNQCTSDSKYRSSV